MPAASLKPLEFLLVEPVAKTPYPPLGLMKLSSLLKSQNKGSHTHEQVGLEIRHDIDPTKIFITSLFTWDIDKVLDTITFYHNQFPHAEIEVGGIGATLLAKHIDDKTGIAPHKGLHGAAENFAPDYSLHFGRKCETSITFTTRGCINKCHFCNVKDMEPDFFVREGWEQDISPTRPLITFWDNNFLASPNFEQDCKTIAKFKKKVDFNQGLYATLYDEERANILAKIDLDPIRFAFDDIKYADSVTKAIRLAKRKSAKEIRVYVLYNFKDSPADFFERIQIINREGALAFPMKYRPPTMDNRVAPNDNWDKTLLRALNLTLWFYYRKGMITDNLNSFREIYGASVSEFRRKLYEINNADKERNRSKPTENRNSRMI